MLRLLGVFFLVPVLFFVSPSRAQDALKPAVPVSEFIEGFREAAVGRWEKDIQKFETLDAETSDPENAILLLGSSSMRLWKEAAEDLAPYPIVNRGYGGARYSDLAIYAERLVRKHKFRGVVIFVANDVTGGNDDRTADEVVQFATHVLNVVHHYQPKAEAFIVEITPTEKRWGVWKEIRGVNAALKELCLTRPQTHFIATAEYYLTSQDEPRKELFREDKLHQNRDGYAIWGRVIKQHLDGLLPNVAPLSQR